MSLEREEIADPVILNTACQLSLEMLLFARVGAGGLARELTCCNIRGLWRPASYYYRFVE